MNRNTRRALVICCALISLVLGCSDTGQGEAATRSSHSGLSVPGLSPVPWDWEAGVSEWNRGTVDLTVADTWAGCSFVDDDTVIDASAFVDSYFNDLALTMNAAVDGSCADTGGKAWNDMGLLERWYYTRTTAGCNRDLSTGFPRAADIQKNAIPLRIESSGSPVDPWRRPRAHAERDLRLPAVQHCIAMRLRSLSPGAMGAEALLLPAAEQRQLQAEVKTRAQLAAVGYAHLLSVFAAPEATSFPPLIGRDLRIPVLQMWSRDLSNEEAVSGMVTDFAAAVQLYITASRELGALLARSGSARLPRGGDASSVAEDEWGPGSWRARTLASYYGGDPLVQEPPKEPPTPWSHQFGKDSPGWADIGPGAISNYQPLPWPDRLESPFVSTDLGGPKPSFFLGLAREADALLLKIDDDAVTSCGRVDQETSKRRMMRSLEADLRTKTCAECLVTGPGPTPGTEICLQCKVFTLADVPDSALADVAALVLWQRHRIGLDDAAKTVALLADFVEPVCADTSGVPDIRPGARTVGGDLSWEYPDGPGGDLYLRVTKDAVFTEPSWLERTTPFTKLAPWRMPQPYSILPALGASRQGFSPIVGTLAASPIEEAKRVLGSISALSAIRDSVIVTDLRLKAYPHPVLEDGLRNARQIVELISAAVGQGTLSVRPMVAASGNNLAVDTDASGNPRWEVSIVVPADDPFWDLTASVYSLGVVKNDRWAQRIVQAPESTAFGKDINAVTSSATWFAFASPSPWPASNPVAKRWTAYVSLPSTDVAWWTFIVRKTPPMEPEPTYGLLAGSMRVWVTESSHGQYLAMGGNLGLAAMRTMTARDDEPSKPKYDGFGLPTTWVPPTDPQLFGVGAGSSAVEHYLLRAKEAAAEATEAVSGAVENMLAEQSDQAGAAAFAALSKKVIEDEQKTLCGAAWRTCEVEVLAWEPSIAVPNVDCVTAFVPDPTDPTSMTDHTLDCLTKSLLESMRGPYELAEPVALHVGDPSAPSFPEYAGGDLQVNFVRQWAAAHSVLIAAADLQNALETAKYAVAQNWAAYEAFQLVEDLNCSPEAMANAADAGRSTTTTTSHSHGEGFTVTYSVPFPTVSMGTSGGTSTSESKTYSTGPLIAQQLKCDEIKAQESAELKALIARMAGIYEALAANASKTVSAASELRSALAEMTGLLLRAQLATEEAALEADLAAATQTTSFGLYRAYHSYDAWRAKALLENARRYSVAARRAIESRYVVDLSTLHGDEPFVAAPSTWADEVYTYDLSLPSAVGLAVTTEGQDSGGIYANVVKDYVGNLERFVEGFAIERPTSSSFEDREVFALPGLQWEPCDLIDDACAGGSPVDAASFAWSFYCPDNDEWVALPASGDASTACGEASKPTRARIHFSLDPWGRVGMDIAHEPFAKRYNARWTRLAANLVGTGIQDCKNAEDPMTCYSQPFIRYNLTHLGPAWVTDDQGHWKALTFDPGWIEGAKALATEMWLDPISDGWSTPEIEAVMRGELRDRPLGGTYELVLEVPPELNLSRLEMVQIMMGTDYWVKQQ